MSCAQVSSGGCKVLCVPVEEALKSETCGISQKKFCENKEGSIFLGDHERCRGLRKTMSPGTVKAFSIPDVRAHHLGGS